MKARRRTLTDTFHHDVFYNEEKDMADFAIKPSAIQTENNAIIVPHARLCEILPLMEEAFGYASHINPDLIVILAPLHSPVLDEDLEYCAITTPQKSVQGRTFKISIAHPLFTDIVQKISYFEEEPACEELYPLISKAFPETEVMPLLSTGHVTRLRRLIDEIRASFKCPLFILSTNISLQSAKKQDPSVIFEAMKKGTEIPAGPCAKLWLQAFGGRWKVGSSATKNSVVHFCAANV